jgi:hypothetical protein
MSAASCGRLWTLTPCFREKPAGGVQKPLEPNLCEVVSILRSAEDHGLQAGTGIPASQYQHPTNALMQQYAST